MPYADEGEDKTKQRSQIDGFGGQHDCTRKNERKDFEMLYKLQAHYKYRIFTNIRFLDCE